MIPSFAVYTLCLAFAFAVPVEKPSGRIVNGNPAVRGQFPYEAFVRMTKSDGYTYYCSGVILSNLWIATTASCIINTTNATVDVGSTTQYATDASRVRVSKMILHKEYDSNSFQNNIALLQLNDRLTWSATIKQISILTTSIADNTNVVAAGWGYIATTNITIVELRYVALKTISNKQCTETYGTQLITDNIICTTTNNDVSKGLCFGDIGGPLVANQTTNPILVGIGNFWSGKGCGIGPDGYVRIGRYADWIQSVIGA